MAKSDMSCVEKLFFPGSRHCALVLQTQVPKLCKDLHLSLLYILIFGTYSKFARKNNFLALCVCFPQPCSSAGRLFAASRSRLQYYRRIISFPQQKKWMKCVVNWIPLRICVRSRNTQPHLEMKCIVNWIPLRICVRSRNTQPHLKVGLGIPRTKADSQWNPVYNAFHRNSCCENEMILR